MEFHANSLTAFDSTVQGNPVVVGGVGYGSAGKRFRVGGAGGGGFLFDSSMNVNYGMGYGGVIADYAITPWLGAGVLIGGGGYAVSKVLTETETQTTLEKISSGGFVLFYPMITAEIQLKKNVVSAQFKLGYFLPNNSRLHSFTIGMTMLFGRI